MPRSNPGASSSWRLRSLGAVVAVAITCQRPEVPNATANDLRQSAGREQGGEVHVALEARTAMWHPSADDGPGLEVAAFGEVGQAPTVPGPLVRVPVGTMVAITMHNRLADTLLVSGISNPTTSDTVLVAPGATATARFRAARAGLFGYAGRTRRGANQWFGGRGGQLTGVIAVDSANAPADRIFAITAWNGAPPIGGDSTFLLTMNGKMWPHTEPLRASVGDSIHWRVINFAGSVHPMHLHGTYFRVDARGTRTGDTAYARDEQRLAVTELLREKESMTITWSPERSGRWLFHCHDAFHVTHEQETNLPVAARMWASALRGDTTPLPREPMPSGMAHGMSGLVMGIDVTGPAPEVPPAKPRRIDLTVQERPRVYGAESGLGFVSARPGAVPADSITIPGPALVLTRGEPVAITVHNRLSTATAVHWHGMELESYFDGVAGWSGAPGRVAPPIAPNDSFVARFTPPRAGTFIYHSHASEVHQISSGMYGPLIVLPPGQRWDAERDRVVIFAVAGTGDSAQVVAHHDRRPLRAGTTYRLRFINITAADLVAAEGLANEQAASWRVVAKDGADLPRPRNGEARL
ncbi:MAG: multicopper oxidase domain-containing protein, partial [Gemmatimonadetes bacterium]|nr:multicopper oxidase domain-containing protein [Gemmatimonadota bacterium]